MADILRVVFEYSDGEKVIIKSSINQFIADPLGVQVVTQKGKPSRKIEYVAGDLRSAIEGVLVGEGL